MNSISIGHAGNESYYLKLGREEYYTSAIDPFGVFKGEGSKLLGIENEKISHSDPRLKNLFLGYSPDGKEILRKDIHQVREYKSFRYEDKEKRVHTFKSEKSVPSHLKDKVTVNTEVRRSVVCYDNVFSAPKDVSILWSLAPSDKKREQIHDIHNQSVMEALKYLENNACYVRTGKGGKTQEKAKAIFSVFHHTTSRDLDPQLHSHAVLLNIGFSKSGKALSLDGRTILEHRYASGMIYQNSLRERLEREFNIKTYDRPFSDGKGVSFGILGISRELRREFSRRSMEIMGRISPDMSGAQVRAEVLASRKEKNFTTQTKDLFSGWRERGEQFGFSWGHVTVRKEREVLKPTEAKTYELVATSLQEHSFSQKKHRNKGRVSSPQILLATLSSVSGKFKNDEVFKRAEAFKDKFTKESGTSSKLYSLNGEGRKLINHEKIREKLYRTAKTAITYYYEWMKSNRKQVLINSKSNRKGSKKIYKLRMNYLYAVGKITRKQYLKFTSDKPTPKGYFKIHIYEALGLISKRKAYYLLNLHHKERFSSRSDPFDKKLETVEPIKSSISYDEVVSSKKLKREKPSREYHSR